MLISRPEPRDRLILALDFARIEDATDFIGRLDGSVRFFKIGLELIYAGGLTLAERLVGEGHHVFLDAKLLDISNTVEKATANIARLGVSMLTVHGHDRKTLEAAVRGRGDSSIKLVANAVMTHLTQADLAEQGIDRPALDVTLHRAAMAQAAGFDGVVPSAQEASAIRRQSGADFMIVTPGIRPTGAAAGDQSRIMTPGRAIAEGADYLVVGRPITQAEDPRAAAEAIVDEIAAALS